MFKFVKGKILLTVQCALVFVFLVYIFKSEFFLECMCPDIYWGKQVANYENTICLSNYKVDELNLSLDRESELFKYSLEDSKKRAQAFGINEEILVEKATKEYEKKIAEIHQDLEYFTTSLAKSKDLLDLAKQRKQKH
jgi:hypothetical protein